jgi:hypothetical protein
VYCGSQNCTDVLERVPGLRTETCLTACEERNKAAVLKVEKGSYIPEEEDPLAVTLPATKAEHDVSYVQQTSYSPTVLGRRCCQQYPVTISVRIWAVLTRGFVNFLSACKTVVGFYSSRNVAVIEITSDAALYIKPYIK